MQLTTRPNSITEFDLVFPGGNKGLLVRRTKQHRDTWTLLVNKRGVIASNTMPSDTIHMFDAERFDTAFFRAMTITADEIDQWEEDHARATSDDEDEGDGE